MRFACTSSFSLSWNWSISSLSDKREEVVSSLRAAGSGRACWEGSLICTMSSRARNPGTEMSILHNRGSLALIMWSTSWKMSDRGSKSKMRWAALSYLSLLMNTSDLRTLLRSGMLTKLRRGVTCFLSAKTTEKPITIRPIKPIIKEKWNTKSRVKGLNPRVPHLALPFELGSEDHHAISQRRLGSRPSCPYWTWEDTIRVC